jgi:signal transduction histidine kinase
MSVTIFIVEDEMVLNQQLRTFLQNYGYTVEMFPHGEPCIRALEAGDIPDLILMDINLGPGRMDGPAVTEEVRRRHDIPVVLHSAYTDEKTLASTRDMTKYGYIQKVPGNEQFVLATIEMALKLHATETELRRREKLYRELSAHLQNVREEQNAHLAQEIHDDIGQLLTALRMNFTHLEQTLDEEQVQSETLDSTVRDMERILERTVKKVRKMSTELRPSVIDTEGIREALAWEVEEFKKNFNVRVNFSGNAEDAELDKRRALQVFRIVQESLTNSVRHSGAEEIDVEANTEDGTLTVAVVDDGSGFDADSAGGDSSFGLIGMKERAAQCGGTLDIRSTPGQGTRIELRMPLHGPYEESDEESPNESGE